MALYDSQGSPTSLLLDQGAVEFLASKAAELTLTEQQREMA